MFSKLLGKRWVVLEGVRRTDDNRLAHTPAIPPIKPFPFQRRPTVPSRAHAKVFLSLFFFSSLLSHKSFPRWCSCSMLGFVASTMPAIFCGGGASCIVQTNADYRIPPTPPTPPLAGFDCGKPPALAWDACLPSTVMLCTSANTVPVPDC